jgi:hypothetical protein
VHAQQLTEKAFVKSPALEGVYFGGNDSGVLTRAGDEALLERSCLGLGFLAEPRPCRGAVAQSN